ncbi:hypothetical protein GCM10023085_69920 [Actinomadura viridis]|uniref:DUF397 domain-containing protein n=1 Tax=Actinomadura viridis TaxID=58110 RepID=UPI0018CBEAE3
MTARQWRTSSYSAGDHTECVEIARLRSGVAARDSKDAAGPVLSFSRSEWGVFMKAVKDGSLDLD